MYYTLMLDILYNSVRVINPTNITCTNLEYSMHTYIYLDEQILTKNTYLFMTKHRLCK